jgi:hypothetical protein
VATAAGRHALFLPGRRARALHSRAGMSAAVSPASPPPLRRWPARRIVKWIALSGAVVFVVLATITAWLLRPEALKARVERTLSERLNLQVTIERIDVGFLPRLNVSGTGLVFRIPNRAELPPFIEIGRFWMDIGPLSALRRHIDTVHLDQMKIAVPPGKERDLPLASGDDGRGAGDDGIAVEHLVTHDAELRFVPDDPDDRPLVFQIHELEIDNVGFNRAMSFAAKLVNPVPRGLIDTTGSFGPWRRDDMTATALEGTYTFSRADLDTIDGIGGELTSAGSFTGRLTEIRAQGTTSTPDFSLDLGGRPVPLETTYDAVIDGATGTTRLERVDARLGDTTIRTSGVIANREDDQGHHIQLNYTIADGRIEDLLRLVADAPTPLLVGDVTTSGSIDLPPGRGKVRQRLRLAGRFGLEDAEFTDGQVNQKLFEFSRRSQGKDEDEMDRLSRVVTNLRGQFALGSGVLRFTRLAFQVPGASVTLAGTYALGSEAIDLRGRLRMQATASSALGGIKSIFLKPFDFIFRKDGAGAVLPVKITGTRGEPKMGIEIGKALRGKY